MLISVIIRTYNGRNSLLKEAVNSVLAQTYKNFEIIIIEDGGELAKPVADWLYNSMNCKGKYVSMGKVGRCVTGNKGLEISSGEYVCFLDDDDQFYPDHLEKLIDAIEKYKVLAVYSDAEEVQTKFLSFEPLNYKEYGRNVIHHSDFSRVLMWRQNYIAIQSVLFNRQLYIENGGFLLHLDSLEDWNLWMRYSLKNDFYHVKNTTSFYRVPVGCKNALSRTRELDKYKQAIRDEQKSLSINLNLDEFLTLHEELVKKESVFYISKDDVKKVLVDSICLNFLYSAFRIFYYKFFKRNKRGD